MSGMPFFDPYLCPDEWEGIHSSISGLQKTVIALKQLYIVFM